MKYFLGFLTSIALIVVVFFLVLRGLTGKDPTTVNGAPAMSTYANTQTIVRFTTDGSITANQTHNAYQIVVGRDQVTIETYKGYDRSVLKMQSYTNNAAAYAQFLGALDRAGFTKGVKDSDAKPIGACATGTTIQMEIIRGGRDIQSFWGTTCKEKGTFRGNLPLVIRLFRAQIPDYSALTSGLRL